MVLRLCTLCAAVLLWVAAASPADPRSLRGNSATEDASDAKPLAAESAGSGVQTSKAESGDAHEEPEDEVPKKLGRLAALLLPRSVSALGAKLVAGLMVFKSMHEGAMSCFESMPGMSAMSLSVFVASFCWTVLSTFWFMDEAVLTQLDALTAYGGLYATMELLLTPTLLFMPNQQEAAVIVQRMIGVTAHQVAEKVFEGGKKFATVIYVFLFVLQVISAVFVYRIAEAQSDTLMANMPDAGDEEEPDFSGPYLLTLLYLLLSYCNFSIVYERLFGKPLIEEFPHAILERLSCTTCLHSIEDRVHHLTAHPIAVKYVPIGDHYVGSAMEAAAGLRSAFHEKALMITARVDDFVCRAHRAAYHVKTVHWVVYLLYGFGAMSLAGYMTVNVVLSRWGSSSSLRIPFACVMVAFLGFFLYFILGTLCGFMKPTTQPPEEQEHGERRFEAKEEPQDIRVPHACQAPPSQPPPRPVAAVTGAAPSPWGTLHDPEPVPIAAPVGAMARVSPHAVAAARPPDTSKEVERLEDEMERLKYETTELRDFIAMLFTLMAQVLMICGKAAGFERTAVDEIMKKLTSLAREPMKPIHNGKLRAVATEVQAMCQVATKFNESQP